MKSIITARVPGKLLLSGEYAVLAGGPAVLACVDRFVTVTLQPASSRSALILRGPADAQVAFTMSAGKVCWGDHVSSLPLSLMKCLLQTFPPAVPIVLSVDSSDFYFDGRKLGLGSSAAVAVAVGAALARFNGTADVLEGVQQAHRTFQEGRGSGADVAAVARGGISSYQRHRNGIDRTTLGWPQGLAILPVAMPAAADTVDHVGRFERWLSASEAHRALVATLANDAGCVLRVWRSGRPAAIIDALKRFTARLVDIDQLSEVGYIGGGHRALMRIAASYDVFYKPCGAGGGDFGVAFATDDKPLGQFAEAAKDAGYQLPRLGVADNVPSVEAMPI